MIELSVFSDFSHRNVYEFARNKGRKIQGNENKRYKRSMCKYRMRKGNERNVTEERERDRKREIETESKKTKKRKHMQQNKVACNQFNRS